MSIVQSISNRLGARGEEGAEVAPVDLKQTIQHAYVLLCDAHKRGIQIPTEIVTVITSARSSAGSDLTPELETKFWNAYGLLSSSIQPAAKARTSYRNIFYVVLAVLLLSQLFYLQGESVRSKLTELDKELRNLPATGATPTPGARPAEEIRAERKAYYRLGRSLLETADSVSWPLHKLGMRTFFTTHDLLDSEDSYPIVRGKLDMLSLFLAGYFLPMLYGLLGACAFVLRKLSDEIDKLTYAHDARVRYSLRLNIGLLSGLAVGWFIKPGVGDAGLVSLSPLALAFVAGYGSDLFFVALDKIVAAFGGNTTSAAANIRDGASGGASGATRPEPSRPGADTAQGAQIAPADVREQPKKIA